jgi:hypothetical protein
MSREALSLEISQVVSRVVSGEPIDAAARGALLAQKYPDLGMSGEMIGEAIIRAANMVGMIKSTPMPAAWPDEPAPEPAVVPARDAGDARVAVPLAAAARSIEDEMAAAVDAEIGSRVAGRTTAPSSSEGNGAAKTDMKATPPRRFAPVAALRRAFFRH